MAVGGAEQFQYILDIVAQFNEASVLEGLRAIEVETEKLRSAAARVSEGGGGNYTEAIRQVSVLEQTMKRVAEIAASVHLPPQVVSQVERVTAPGSAVSRVTEPISRPASQASFQERVAQTVALNDAGLATAINSRSGSGGRRPPIPPAEPPTGPPPDEDPEEAKRILRNQKARERYAARRAQQEAEAVAAEKQAQEESIAAEKEIAAARRIQERNEVRRSEVNQKAGGGPGNKSIPPGPPILRGDSLGEYKKKIGTAINERDIQEELAFGGEAQLYARDVAAVRIALQRQSASIEGVLAGNTYMDEEVNRYARAVADTRIAQAKTNASVNVMLSNTDAYSEVLALNKSAQLQVKAQTELLLATDNEYIQASAEVANARRAIAARSKAAELQGAGFENQTPSGFLYATKAVPGSQEEGLRKAYGVEQLTQLEGSSQALAQYRKAQVDLVAVTERQLISSKIEADQAIGLAGDKRTEAQLVAQRKGIEARLSADLESALVLDKQYVDASAELAVLKRQRAAAEKRSLEQTLAGDQVYIDATAEAAVAKRLSVARIKEQELKGIGLDKISTSGLIVPAGQGTNIQNLQALEAANARRVVLEKARLTIAEEGIGYSQAEIEELAKANQLEAELNLALKTRIAAAQEAAYQERKGTPADKSTGFQRFQQGIASRNDPTQFKDPTQYAQLGQFLKSKFLTTAGFAVSGIATYAAFSELQKMVTESKGLELALAGVKAQFDSLGDSAGFEKFRTGIKGIAADTGTLASQVAALASQLKGAFGQGAGGNLTDQGVLQQTKSAAEFAKITGVSLQDVGQNLSAIAKTYDVNLSDVGDKTIALFQRTGVPAKELVDALGQIAPISDQVGLSIDKTAALIATAAEYSGRSATVIGQSIARSLTSAEANASKINQFFGQAAPQLQPKVLSELGAGQTGKVLEDISSIYNKLSQGQQSSIRNLLGRPRDVQDLIPLLENYNGLVKNTEASQKSAGTQTQAYAQLQQSLALQLQRLTSAFTQIGESLLKLGLGQALGDVAKALGAIIGFTSGVLGFFSKLNDLAGGLPAKFAVMIAELYGVLKVLELIRTVEIGNVLTGILGGITSGGAGLFNVLGGGGAAAGAAEGAAGAGAGRGLLSRILGRSAPAAVGAGETTSVFAEASGIAAPVAATAAPGFGAALLSATPAIAAVAGLTAYLKYRSVIGKSADKKLRDYERLDRASLEKLVAAQQEAGTPASERFGRALAGAPTDLQAAQQALRENITKNDLGPQIDSIIGAVKGQANATTYFGNLSDTLAKKQGKNEDDFNKVAGAVAALKSGGQRQLLSGALSAAQRSTLTGESSDIGSFFIGGGIDILQKKAQELARLGQGTDAAKKIREQFFGGSTQSTEEIRKQLAGLNKEVDTKGTVFGVSVDQLPGAKDFFDHLKGKDLEKAIKSINAAQKVIEESNQISKQFTDLKVAKVQYQVGTITGSNYLTQLQAAVASDRQTLESILSQKNPNQDLLDQAAQQLATDQADLGTYYKSQFDKLKTLIDTRTVATGLGPVASARFSIKTGTAALSSNNSLLDPTSADTAKEIVKQQRDLLQFQADHASSIAAQRSIFEKGFKIDPHVLQELQVGALRNLPPVFDDALKASVKIANLGDYDHILAEMVIAKGGFNKGLEGWIKTLEQKIREFLKIGGRAADVAVLRRSVSALKTLEDSGIVPTSLTGGVADTGGATTADIQSSSNALASAAVSQDPLAAAIEARRQATEKYNADIALATSKSKSVTPGQRSTALVDAQNQQAAIISSNQQVTDAQNNIAQSGLDLLAAQAQGDPVKVAQANIAKANLAIQQAQAKGDKAAENSARAQLIQANLDLDNAMKGISEANLAVLSAMADGDALSIAQIALAQANEQLAHAHGEAERIQALAAQINAQHAIRDAIFAIADAQSSLLVAIDNAAGDTVKAARDSLTQAQKVLARDLARGLNPNDPRVTADRQRVVEAQAALRDAALNDSLGDINFLLATHKISNAQAIAKLKVLDQNEKLTKQEHQQLEQQIYDLQHQANQDLQFNLPSDIKLPTLYEARRFNEGGGGAGGSHYQDNRRIDIRITTNAKVDGKDVNTIIGHVTDAINAPPRFGTRPGTY